MTRSREVRLLDGPRAGVVRVVWDRSVRELRFPVTPLTRYTDHVSVCAPNPDHLLYQRMVAPDYRHPGPGRYVDAIDAYGRPLYAFIRIEPGGAE